MPKETMKWSVQVDNTLMGVDVENETAIHWVKKVYQPDIEALATVCTVDDLDAMIGMLQAARDEMVGEEKVDTALFTLNEIGYLCAAIDSLHVSNGGGEMRPLEKSVLDKLMQLMKQ